MTDEPAMVNFELNGRRRALAVDASATLLDTLREEFALTGSKKGCNSGLCGACNVLVDGRCVRGCLTLCATLGNATVRTIEGLSAHHEPGLVQQAFLDAGAIQCGFCMSGMIVSATELLQRNPRPTRDEIRHGLAGNLCRCSGYVKVIEAVELASARMVAAGRAGE